MLIANLFKYWTLQIFSPSRVLKEKYTAFRSLLTHDKRAHELMAELEDIYYRGRKRDFNAVISLCTSLSRHVALIIADLARVCPGRYADLAAFYKKIDAYIRHMTAISNFRTTPPHVRDLTQVGPEDLQLVGGKAFNLGIVKNRLNIPVPDGFVITTRAYQLFIEQNGLRQSIDAHLAAVDISDPNSLETCSRQIQEQIFLAQLPPELALAINDIQSVRKQADGFIPAVAMRSSAVGEDSKASFAGQYLTVLNVQPQDLGDTYRKIIAGKYTPEAIAYRISYGLTDADTPMAVLVLRMIAARASGVIYTTELVHPAGDRLSIHSIWGLGELLVGGQTAADILTVSKKPPFEILEKKVAEKSRQMLARDGGRIESQNLTAIRRTLISLNDRNARTLAGWGLQLEKYFQQAQDIEWVVDDHGKCFILQSRPLNTAHKEPQERVCVFDNVPNEKLLTSGETAASGIAAGPVYNLKQQPDLHEIPKTAILVAPNALPRYTQAIHRLGAIVTDAGSPAGHLASVAREFGIPMLVNTGSASDLLAHGRHVTVHADDRSIYAGTVTEMLESACAQPDLIIDSPFMRKLEYLMKFVATLDLVDPQADTFAPQYCRSLHDIIRFAHEKAVAEMFHVSDNRLRKLSLARKLTSHIPMPFFVLDVGGGLSEKTDGLTEIAIEQVENDAMRALWGGLTHPGIHWGDFSHFDWEAHDRTVMSGGIASPDATMFASHAVISNDYMNLNLRFGYHFVIVDAQCGPETADHIILFRFSGGGADMDQRMLRTDFLSQVLRRLGFDVTVVTDLIDARFSTRDQANALQVLDMIGRLLGATRLMDMYLKDPDTIEGFVDDFMQGRYHFASTEM